MKVLKYSLLFAALLALTPVPADAKAKRVKVTLTKDNSFVLKDVVTAKSTTRVVQKAKELDSRLENAKDPLFLVLDTPGGSISAGMEMIENLRNMNRKIHTITMFGASMGFETVQGLGKRLLPADGTLMSHKGWGFLYGEFPGQLDNRYSWVLKRSQRLAERAVARTNGKHTLESYSALIENEYWCDGADCMEQGFADYLVKAKCDKSLSGTHIDLWDRWLYEGWVIKIKVKFSDCPLSTGYIDYDIYINDEPLYGTLEEVKKKDLTAEEEMFNAYFGINDTNTPNLTSDQLKEIQARAVKRINDISSRKVVVLP